MRSRARRRGIALVVAAAVLAGLALVSREHPDPGVGSWLDESGLVPEERVVAGRRVRYLRAGQGPAVVLIHGLASSIYTWKDVLPRLSRAHDVVALDLPGFGGSEQPADLGFGDLVAVVPALLDALDVERASLVGNSLGGAVAATVAALHPDRVPALVLIDAAGFQRDLGDLPAVLRVAVADPTGLLAGLPLKRPLTRVALLRVFHDDSRVTDARVAEYVAPLLRPGAVASLRSLLETPPARLESLREALPGIRAPTLVVWGREDAWIPVSHAERFAEVIPDAARRLRPHAPGGVSGGASRGPPAVPAAGRLRGGRRRLSLPPPRLRRCRRAPRAAAGAPRRSRPRRRGSCP